MNFKKFITYLILFNLVSLIVIIFLFLFNPKLFYFRSWEFFDDFVYKGLKSKTHIFEESGDLSRGYLFQKFSKKNKISVNDLGNRLACFNNMNQNSALMLGSSALFGSYISDEETLPKLLCKNYPEISFYNGSRIHEMNLLKIKEFKFDTIIFTAAEFEGFDKYCRVLDTFKKDRTILSSNDLKIKNMKYNWNNKDLLKRPIKYLSFKLNVLLDTSKTFLSPNEHIYLNRTLQQKEEKEINCIKELNNYFKKQKLKTIFLYFPEKRTIIPNTNIKKESHANKSYISSISTKLFENNINYLDTVKCLSKSKNHNKNIFYFHDTHMTPYGIKELSNCFMKKNFF